MASYPGETPDASLYYHHHQPTQAQPHHQQSQTMISEPSSMMDSSYNLPCDYNTTAGYNNCPPVLHADYPYQQYTSNATAPSAVPQQQAHPCDAQSSGYYGSPADHHYTSLHQQQQQMDNGSSGALMPPYDCYSSHDHLEKYQAAFVDALESHNTSMDTSSAIEGAGTASNSSADMDPLQIHSGLPSQQLTTPSEFHYEYETNYGNNEWTTTMTGGGNYNAYSAADSYSTDAVNTSETEMSILPNYCFAACVFTPSSTEPANSAKVEISTFSPTPITNRHFESYDYQALNEEPLHSAL